LIIDGEATDQTTNPLLAVYRIRGTPAQFVGLVYDAPEEQSAIARRSINTRCRRISAAGLSRSGGIESNQPDIPARPSMA
jgi:hypothetical protein